MAGAYDSTDVAIGIKNEGSPLLKPEKNGHSSSPKEGTMVIFDGGFRCHIAVCCHMNYELTL